MKHKTWIILMMLVSLTTGAMAQNNSIKLQKEQALKFNKSALVAKQQGRFLIAEEKHKIALEIYKKLAKKDPRFYSEVSTTIEYLGELNRYRHVVELKEEMRFADVKANYEMAMKAASIRIGGYDYDHY